MSTDQPSHPIRVFISYSRADIARVDRLEAYLISYGFLPWVDRSHLEGGEHWAAQIERALLDCDVVVAVKDGDDLTHRGRRELTHP